MFWFKGEKFLQKEGFFASAIAAVYVRILRAGVAAAVLAEEKECESI